MGCESHRGKTGELGSGYRDTAKRSDMHPLAGKIPPLYQVQEGTMAAIAQMADFEGVPVVLLEGGDSEPIPQGGIGYSDGANPCLIVLALSQREDGGKDIHLMHAQGLAFMPEDEAIIMNADIVIAGGGENLLDAMYAIDPAIQGKTYELARLRMTDHKVFGLMLVDESVITTDPQWNVPSGVYFSVTDVEPFDPTFDPSSMF